MLLWSDVGGSGLFEAVVDSPGNARSGELILVWFLCDEGRHVRLEWEKDGSGKLLGTGRKARLARDFPIGLSEWIVTGK